MALTTLLPPWTGVGGMLCLEARSPHNQAPFQLPSFCLRSGSHPVSMKYTTDDLVPISGQDAALGECPEGVQGWATVKLLTAGFLAFPALQLKPTWEPTSGGRGPLHVWRELLVFHLSLLFLRGWAL